MATKVYDADQITISFGTVALTGLAEDDVLTIEQDSDDFTDVAGLDGEVTRSKSRDRRATITVRLMQTSDSNDLLSAINNADFKAPNGAGIAQLMIRDRGTGRALYAAAEAWIAKPPQVVYGRSAKVREWKLRAASLERLDGGS
jgi:hypothetical protein